VSAALLALARISSWARGTAVQFDAKRSAQSSIVRKLALAVAVLVFVGVVLLVTRATRAESRRVGSKDFTESALLAEIVAQMLEARGVSSNAFRARREPATRSARRRHTRSLSRIHRHVLHCDTSSRADHRSARGLRQVKQEYADKFKVEVSQPLGFENTFAILVRGDDARR
jgi:glycine betaine/choline ABC-type transport system substrate-binding protein